MKKPMKIDHRYVTFRVDETKSAVCVNFIDTEKRIIAEQIFVNLGEGDGRKSFVDMSEYMGMTLDVQMLPCESEWAIQPEGVLTEDEAETRRKYIACEDDYVDAPHYAEPYRPLYHFTTQRGWMNDPNGCIYFDGVWHLYYQHCPGSTASMWDNNHWGHATSRDLFTWVEEQPVLRYPHQASGTGFIDRESGKVCVTTSNLIFESPDGGYTYDFKSYNTAGCGDPKIFWHEESGRYISITLRDITSYQISSSPDLVEWRHESDIENFRECPEFCKYRIEGTDEYKWVLNGGDGAYQIGDFDGREFKPDPIDPDRLDKYVHVMEATRNFSNKYNGFFIDDTQPDTENRYTAYAFQNFANAPNGRHVRIAWYTVDFAKYGELFTQAMTAPQELTLRRTPMGLRICAMPADEIRDHYTGVWVGDEHETDCTDEPGHAFDVEAAFPSDGRLIVGMYELSYLPEMKKIRVVQYSGFRSPADSYGGELGFTKTFGETRIVRDFTVPFIPDGDGTIRVRALFDKLITEFFFGDGEVYLPLKPDDPDRPCGMYVSCDKPAQLKVSTIARTMK